MFGKFQKFSSFFIDADSTINPSTYNENQLNGGFFGTIVGSPGTQKAKGVFFLQDKRKEIKNTFCYWNVPKHILFHSGVRFDTGSFNFPVFARPCPVNPRHGFVDSTLCNNAEELNQVSAATYEAESDAEILITKPVDSHYNAIINGNIITFADSNDGATAGRNCKYFYISDDPISSMLGLDERKVISPDEIPFYEFVFGPWDNSNFINLVQVRSAPKTPRVKDFVPATVEVKNILKAEGDLLEWESLLKTVDPKTTIVDHTNGSLSSHYAIHAIVNKVPIFTTYLPPIGSFVEPTVEGMDITQQDKDKFGVSFARGFAATNNIWNKCKYQSKNIDYAMGNIVRLALATLHNYSSLALSKDYELLGMVLGLFSRVAFAVSCGETRYNKKRADKFFFSNKFYNKMPPSGRSCYYEYSMSSEVKSVIGDIVSIYRIFDQMKWDNNYGGKRWAQCTESAINLFNACVDKDIKLAVELFNRVINENHNGGKYLNKVVGSYDFDEASIRPSIYALKNFQHIVDILSVAWDTTTNITQSFEEKISLIWDNEKDTPNPFNKLKNTFIKATGDKITAITIVDSNGNEYSISIPTANNNYLNSTSCFCSSCIPTGKFDLHSVPFWIVDSTGGRIVSKAYLARQLDKLGLSHLKIM